MGEVGEERGVVGGWVGWVDGRIGKWDDGDGWMDGWVGRGWVRGDGRWSLDHEFFFFPPLSCLDYFPCFAPFASPSLILAVVVTGHWSPVTGHRSLLPDLTIHRVIFNN